MLAGWQMIMLILVVRSHALFEAFPYEDQYGFWEHDVFLTDESSSLYEEYEDLLIPDAPHQVAILHYWQPSKPIFLCEGSIVAPHYVVTYSTCGHAQVQAGMTVRAGSADPFHGGSIHDVVEFLPYSMKFGSGTPAVLSVLQRFEYDTSRQPIPLADADSILVGNYVMITNFRRSDDMPVLQERALQIIDNDFCDRNVPVHGLLFMEKSFCAVIHSSDRHDFASGTPAVRNGSLVGIGRGGYYSHVGIFLEVSTFSSWIKRMVSRFGN